MKQRLLDWLGYRLPESIWKYTIVRDRNGASGRILAFRLVLTKSLKSHYRQHYWSQCYEFHNRNDFDEAFEKALGDVFTFPFVHREPRKIDYGIIKKSGRQKLFTVDVYLDIAGWDLQIKTKIKK